MLGGWGFKCRLTETLLNPPCTLLVVEYPLKLRGEWDVPNQEVEGQSPARGAGSGASLTAPRQKPKSKSKSLPPEERAKLLAQKICIKCGQPFSYLEPRPYITADGTTKHFYYCVHETWEGGRRKRAKHYCSSDEYVYVSKFQQDIGLTLKGAMDRDRWLDYTMNIIQTMTDRALEEPENVSLKVNVIQGLLKINELVQRSLAELGVPTTTPVVATEIPEPSTKLELDRLAGRTVIAIVYPDGQRMLRSIESMEKDCKLNIYNPKICQAFETIVATIKEGGG